MLKNKDISVKELRYLYVIKLLDEKKEMEVKEEVKEILSYLVSENDERFLRNPTTGNKTRETLSDIFMDILHDLIGKDYNYTEISIIGVGNRNADEIQRDFFTPSNNSERNNFDHIKESKKAVIFMAHAHAVIWLGIYFLFYFRL